LIIALLISAGRGNHKFAGEKLQPARHAAILISACEGGNPDKRNKMSGKNRRTVTTIETRELWIVRKNAPQISEIFCSTCPHEVVMLTPQEAARHAGVSQRAVYRWVEDGRLHFVETADGDLLVCLSPLFHLSEG